ncbi:hypothetical protein HAALTHF_01770n [Vreelandella aquamarina]|nr:hypothetical protein HAALTHF_01770n [Halomonas axialensis]
MSSPRPRLQCNVLDERLHDYLPTYATTGSAGMDLRALLDEPLIPCPQRMSARPHRPCHLY